MLLLLFIRIMGALMAKMMAPLHNIPYTVCNVHKPIYIIYKSVLWLWLIIVQSTCRVSIGVAASRLPNPSPCLHRMRGVGFPCAPDQPQEVYSSSPIHALLS